jgi:hypothetical protein
MELAKLTQRHTMGVVDPASAITLFQKVFQAFGLSKDPEKQRYDELRQNLWETFSEVVDTVDSLEDQGKLNSGMLLSYIQTAEKVMSDLKGATDSMRAKIEATWLDPRYHDFYDFMKRVVDDWRLNLLPSLPAGGIRIPGTDTEISPGTFLTGGLLLLGLLRGRA